MNKKTNTNRNRYAVIKSNKYSWEPTYSNQGFWLYCIHDNALWLRNTINHFKSNLICKSHVKIKINRDKEAFNWNKQNPFVHGCIITLCLVPWYLFPGLPNPTINQGVYSALTPLLASGNEALMRKLVEIDCFCFWRKWTLQGLLG